MHGEVLLVLLPVPDFSMPFNVICLVCTVIAMLFGPVHTLTTKMLVLHYCFRNTVNFSYFTCNFVELHPKCIIKFEFCFRMIPLSEEDKGLAPLPPLRRLLLYIYEFIVRRLVPIFVRQSIIKKEKIS